MFVGLFGSPDDACGGARGVEAGVGLVAFVGLAELAMDGGAEFCMVGSVGENMSCLGLCDGGPLGLEVVVGRLKLRGRMRG